LGLSAFVMLAPPVYAVQVLLVQFVPSRHPLILLLKENPDPRFLMIIGLSAVAVAPLSEEFFFRLLLQGWLEKEAVVGAGRRGLLSVGWLGKETDKEVCVVEPQDNNPDVPPSVAGTNEMEVSNETGVPEDGEGMTVPNWPILASGALFALMHASHGPDPIPLFLFALGLGYLYQRTHRILPSIIAHLLLNFCSLAALTMELIHS
jgi:membrane protease YdiL (CAAX protease family)